MRQILVAAVAALGMTGCIIVDPDPPATDPCAGVTGTPVYRVTKGAGVTIAPGSQAGYGITANLGGSYRIVWTGDAAASGAYRNFQGTVWMGGQFRSFTPGCAGGSCPLEMSDVVSDPTPTTEGGERIDFNCDATTGIDGFDFVVSAEPVYFDLTIDGRAYPELVFFAAADLQGQQSNTCRIPFGLTSQ